MGEGRDWDISLPAGRGDTSWHTVPDIRFLAHGIVIKILFFVVSRMTNNHNYWSVNGLQEPVLPLAQVRMMAELLDSLVSDTSCLTTSFLLPSMRV